MAAYSKAELAAMGERIAELRRVRGLRQQAIADEVGVVLRTYQMWQQGKHPPEGENLLRLARVLGTTPKFILRGDTPEPFQTNGDIISRLDRIEALLKIIADSTQLEDAITRIVAEALGQPLPPVTPPPSESGGEKLPKGRRPPRAA